MTQLALDFTAPRLAAARAAGEHLSEKAADRAEREFAEFREKARAFVLTYLAQHGVSSSELITDAAVLAGIRVPDTRAFGAIYRRLAAENKIAFAGHCLRVKGHSTAGGRLWRLVQG